MYKIKLDKMLYDYMIIKLDDEIKNKITESVKSDINDVVYFEIDVDTNIDLMEWVEDKQLEIGFIDEDYLNDDGKKLQTIYDLIYDQTNN